MASALKEFRASFVVGASVIGLVYTTNRQKPPAKSTCLALATLYPVWVFPFGVVASTAIKQLTEHFTPFDFKKSIKEKPGRLQNYMFNKRYMMVDLPIGQVALPFMLATGSFYIARLLEDFYRGWLGADEQGQHFKRRLIEQDAVSLVKARWAFILLKIMNEIFGGYREDRKSVV